MSNKPNPPDPAIDRAAEKAAEARNAPPADVPIQPLPTNCRLEQVPTPDGKMLIAVQFQTPQGVNVFFLDPPSARRIGHQLQRLGSAGQSGLFVPNGGASG